MGEGGALPSRIPNRGCALVDEIHEKTMRTHFLTNIRCYRATRRYMPVKYLIGNLMKKSDHMITSIVENSFCII